MNSLVGSLPDVGSRGADAFFDRNPEISKVGLRGYPWVESLPSHIAEAALLAVSDPVIGPSLGIPELRSAIADITAAECGSRIGFKNIAITPGAMAALNLLWRVLVSSDRAVLVPSPTYFCEGSIRMAGIEYRPYLAEKDGRLDWDALVARIDGGVGAIYLCNPNNPTGRIFSDEDLDRLEAVRASNPDVWIVIDESYESLVYDAKPHRTAAALGGRVVVVRSMSKSFAMPWLRVGWIVGPEGLTTRLQRVMEWIYLYGSSLNQRVALAAIFGNTDHLSKLNLEFELARDEMVDYLRGKIGLNVPVPEAGPFIYPELPAGFEVSESEIVQLWKLGLPVVGGSEFGGGQRDRLRIPFGGASEDRKRGAQILLDWISERK